MSAEFFLDTNVIAYSFDTTAPAKQARAQQLIGAGISGKGAISYQVIQEFMNVALKRWANPMSTAEARTFLDRVLLPLCRVHSGNELYRRALEVHERWKFGPYDSLVVAAAQQAGCLVLFTEDLQHGQRLEQLTVVNPFI